MNDYKELIENVRICASGDCCGCTLHDNKINCQEVLLESAADAIEHLVKEGEYIPTDTLRKYHAWLLEEYRKNPTSENLHSIDMAISWLKAYANYKCVNVDFCN